MLVETYPGGPLVAPAERAAIKAGAEQHVRAVLDVERAAGNTFGRHTFGSCPGDGCGYLFDPTTMPTMYERANAVMHHLQTSHEIEYIDRSAPGSPPYDPDDPNNQGHMFVHFVNQPTALYVFRDKVEMFRWLWSTAWPQDRCNVRESLGCKGDYAHYTVFLPLKRGQFLVMFEACLPCLEHLNAQAEGGRILAEANAWAAVGRPKNQESE